MNDEDRIRAEYPKVRRKLYPDHWMAMARRWKRPIREIKRIVGWEPYDRKNPTRVGVFIDGAWVMYLRMPEQQAWGYAYRLEYGQVAHFHNHVYDFAWVFDLEDNPLPYDRKPESCKLRGEWIRLKDLPRI